ncbi:MAG: hypothetical protein Q7S48_00180 [bacterium]|nr:hypothetical protein [bacterium]
MVTKKKIRKKHPKPVWIFTTPRIEPADDFDEETCGWLIALQKKGAKIRAIRPFIHSEKGDLRCLIEYEAPEQLFRDD